MRPKTLIPAVLLVWLASLSAAYGAVQITSVSPSIAGQGTTVTVTGGPFSAETAVLLGENRIVPDTVEDRQLTLTIPALPPGAYVLRLTEGGRVSREAFNLRITEPLPRIAQLDPNTIKACQSGPPPVIAVAGSGFLAGASLLLDGAGVPVESIAPGEILFTPPNLSGGLHQVVVVNPGGTRSLARALEVDATPAIDSVTIGNDNVTSYEVMISGRNFLGASRLVVDGKTVPSAGHSLPQEDSVRYVDCNTIVYTRHPYSSTPKDTAIQIVNPGAAQTPVFHTEIP